MADLYGPDLAHIHASGFSELAERATPEIIAWLRSCGIAKGVVGDVGCGAGHSTRLLCEAGYGVWALDISAELLGLARTREPRALFLPAGSAYAAAFPDSAAIIALGEPLTYHPVGSDADRKLAVFLDAAARALPRGGALAFDLIVCGEPGLSGRAWREAADWAVLVETREDMQAGWLERAIVTFRREAALYRRDEEVHEVRVFEEAFVLGLLRDKGFAATTASAYGGYALAPRRRAFQAIKQS